MSDDKEEKEMATEVLEQYFTLNEEEANKILKTPRTIIKENNIFNDIHLTKKERIAHAANILSSRKCK